MKRGIQTTGLVATINTTRETDARDTELKMQPTEERVCIYERGTYVSVVRYFKTPQVEEFTVDHDSGLSLHKKHLPHLMRALTLALLPKEARVEAIQDLVDALTPRGEHGPGSGA